jgi:hypothetical protein
VEAGYRVWRGLTEGKTQGLLMGQRQRKRKRKRWVGVGVGVGAVWLWRWRWRWRRLDWGCESAGQQRVW